MRITDRELEKRLAALEQMEEEMDDIYLGVQMADGSRKRMFWVDAMQLVLNRAGVTGISGRGGVADLVRVMMIRKEV